ncbi:MAG: DsbC family protein [bacterium]
MKLRIAIVIFIAGFLGAMTASTHAEETASGEAVSNVAAAHSAADTDVSAGVAEQILTALRAARSDLEYGEVSPSPVAGIYRVRVNKSQSLYVTADGKHIIAGDMYEVRPGMFTPVEDRMFDEVRRHSLAEINPEDLIVFPSTSGATRAFLYVFTDIDCGYCRLLHKETVPGLNAAGVEVRYLAFPRAGLGSESYEKLATAWCAEDPQDALTQYKLGNDLPKNVCPDNPVEAELQMGIELGVAGTPALILADGTLLPGYRSTEDLLTILGLN